MRSNSTLGIKGSGSLTATGGGGSKGTAAGIGGGSQHSGCDTIVINGGTVTAIGGSGSQGGTGGDITINGGTVTATGNGGAPDIGSKIGSTNSGSLTVNDGSLVMDGGNGFGPAGTGDFKVTGGSISIAGQTAPNITSIDPASGYVSGGTAVTLTGTGFNTSTNVSIDGTSVSDIVYVDATTITCKTPSSAAGAKNVAAFSPVTGGSTLANGFTCYTSAITADSTSLYYGSVVSGQTSSKSVNVGGITLTGDITYALGGTDVTAFSVSETSWTPSSGGELSIAFSPTQARAYSAELTLSSPDAVDVVIPLSGTGYARPSYGSDDTYAPIQPSGSFIGDSDFEKGSNMDLVFLVQKDFAQFMDVKINGKTLVKDVDYKAERGSTKISLYADYLNTLSVGSHTLVVGFTDGTSATATFTVKDAVTDEPISWENPFTDVFESDWFYNDVKYTHQNGLFAGTGANTFSPQMPMTRGMVVTVLGRLAGIDIADYIGNSFDDVDTSQYYTPYVKWAVEMGIVSGVGNNNYAPDADISRQDLAVILYIYAVKMGIALPETETAADFDDGSDIASYAAAAVEAMQKTGIISGKPGNVFDPQGIATRAEVAAMLHRFVEAVK